MLYSHPRQAAAGVLIAEASGSLPPTCGITILSTDPLIIETIILLPAAVSEAVPAVAAASEAASAEVPAAAVAVAPAAVAQVGDKYS